MASMWNSSVDFVYSSVLRVIPKYLQPHLELLEKSTQEITGMPMGSAIFICILTSILLLVLSCNSMFSSKTKFKGEAVIVLGLCGSGKTALFHQLCSQTVPETVSSMKEQVGTADICIDNQKKHVKIVDFPGHKQLRDLNSTMQIKGRLSYWVPLASSIVFLFDSTDVSDGTIKMASEFLYDLLTNPVLVDHGIPLLIAFNKMDDHEAKNGDIIKKKLETELEFLKKTRHSLETQGVEGEQSLFLGTEGQPFAFNLDSTLPIRFTSCSVKKDNLGDIRDFLFH